MVQSDHNGPSPPRSPALALASALEYNARATHKLLVLLERSPGGPEGGVVVGALEEDGELTDDPASGGVPERALPQPVAEEEPPAASEEPPGSSTAPDPTTDLDTAQALPPPGTDSSIQGATRPAGYYTIAEAAEILDMASSGLRYRIRSGRLPATTVPSSTPNRSIYFIAPEDIQRELARLPYQRYKKPRKDSEPSPRRKESELLTTDEAAKILGLSSAGVLRRIKRGELPATRGNLTMNSRPQYLIRREDLEAQRSPRYTGWRASRKDPKAEAAKRKKKKQNKKGDSVASQAADLQRLTSKLDSVSRDIENVEALAGRMGETGASEDVTS